MLSPPTWWKGLGSKDVYNTWYDLTTRLIHGLRSHFGITTIRECFDNKMLKTLDYPPIILVFQMGTIVRHDISRSTPSPIFFMGHMETHVFSPSISILAKSYNKYKQYTLFMLWTCERKLLLWKQLFKWKKRLFIMYKTLGGGF
jgi:hypothetical protein